MKDDKRERARVADKIESHVLAFCVERGLCAGASAAAALDGRWPLGAEPEEPHHGE